MSQGKQAFYDKYNQYVLFLLVSLILFLIFEPFAGNWFLAHIDQGIISEATIHGIDIKSRKSNFLLLNFFYLLVALTIYWVYRKGKSTLSISNRPEGNEYIGITLLFLISYLFFAGTPYSFYPDLFESANPTLCIDRISHNQIPFIHYLSSHMLSEQLVPVIYNYLHPDAGVMEWISWKWINSGINLTILYLLFSRWLDSKTIPILIIFFYPFVQWIIPKEFVVGLFPLLFIKPNMTSRQSFLPTFLLGLGILWKIDSGIAAIGASFFTLFYLALNNSLQIKRFFIPVLVYTLSTGAVFFLIYLAYPALTDNFHLALDYFSSDQAHGRTVLTNWPKDFRFTVHHYVFPFLSVLMLLVTMFSKKQDFITLSLIYCVPFYLFNFQRGLVRHSFTSGTDVHLSSLIYLIFGLFIISFLLPIIGKKNKIVGRNRSIQLSLVFILSTSILILLFKPGNYLHKPSYFNTGIKNIQHLVKNGLIKKEWTSDRDGYLMKNVEPLKHYLDKHLEKDQTFLDFSNHPLLYHLTGRTNPSYFNQFLQNVATVRQQEIIIGQLKNYNIPVVLYSFHPREWLDMTDNVPNGLRYHLIHEYIKEKYAPLGMVNNKILWLRKDLPRDQYAEGTEPIPCQPINLYAGYLPQLLTQYDQEPSGHIIKNDTVIYGNSEPKRGQMLSLRLTGTFSSMSHTITIEGENCTHSMKFKTFEDKSTYIIPLDYFPTLPSKIDLGGLMESNIQKELIYLHIED